MAFKDEFILQPSDQFTVSGRQEADQGLELYLAPDTGSISGVVQDTNGDPIEGAAVKVFTSENIPFEHANTNATGAFALDQIPAGNYTITASKAGYLIPNNTAITVTANSATPVTLTLPVDTNLDTITIYGIISDNTGQPLSGAEVELFLGTGPSRQSVAIVNTNNDGQYLFTELSDGNYEMVVNKFGYLALDNVIGNLTQSGFYNKNFALIVDPDFNSGTISGIVKNHQNGGPVANAIVALYSVSGNTETIVRITRTNANGMYLFGDISSGNYIVKATVQTDI